MAELPLGRETGYPDTYSPELLFPVERAEGRAGIGLESGLPFHGVDLWTAFEFGWLAPSGRPLVAVLQIAVPAESPRLIESKSLKLYLGSFAMSRYASTAELGDILQADLSAAAGAPVRVRIIAASEASIDDIVSWPGDCVDYEDVACDATGVDARLLRTASPIVTESLHSHVLRSLCPVTGQPDTGSVLIRYRGPRIERDALLQYIASFRTHTDFHEVCVERIFLDLGKYCACEQLSVFARYNRRGGIDINPFRSNFEDAPPPGRLWRQ